MRHIQGQIHIDRPVDDVFDFIADSRNEPSYNPAMRHVTMLTEEPIGAGSQFKATMGRAQMPLLVTITDFDRPNELGSTTTSSLMDTAGSLRFSAVSPGRTVMSWDWQVEPKGWLRLLGPLFTPIGHRMEQRIWTAARDALQTGKTQPPGTRT